MISVRKSIAVLVAASVAAPLAGCGLQPEPLTGPQVAAYALDKKARFVAGEAPITQAIGLDEAIARGLRYNLDYRVEAYQTALRVQDLDVADFHLLPNLVANSNFLGRNNNLAAYSQSVTTGLITLEPSVSTPKNDLISDLTLSYNTLDFGLSYIRARQAADEVLIAQETKRKVTNRIVQDIRTAYWRAYSSQRLSERLARLQRRVEHAISDSRTVATGLDTSPIAALTYERELIEIKRQAQAIESEMAVAKAQLAALMNVPPDVQFTLSGRGGVARSPVFKRDFNTLVDVALVNRPELRENQYRSRINAKEAYVALLELLPNAQAYFGGNNDTSKYLFHANWLAYGAHASWNLLNVFKYPARIGQVNAQEALLDAKALALTMAVVTQVQVARIRLFEAENELKIAREFLDVQGRLLHQVKAQADTEKASEQTLIREEMNTLVAESRKDIAFALYENAYGLVFEAIGLDPFDRAITTGTTVEQIARVLDDNWLDGEKRIQAAAIGLRQAPANEVASADAIPSGTILPDARLPDMGLRQ